MKAAMIVMSVVLGMRWIQTQFWLVPCLTVSRVINWLHSSAEQGRLMALRERRVSDPEESWHWLSHLSAPFHIGFHFANYMETGMPFRYLPDYRYSLSYASQMSPNSYPPPTRFSRRRL